MFWTIFEWTLLCNWKSVYDHNTWKREATVEGTILDKVTMNGVSWVCVGTYYPKRSTHRSQQTKLTSRKGGDIFGHYLHILSMGRHSAKIHTLKNT